MLYSIISSFHNVTGERVCCTGGKQGVDPEGEDRHLEEHPTAGGYTYFEWHTLTHEITVWSQAVIFVPFVFQYGPHCSQC